METKLIRLTFYSHNINIMDDILNYLADNKSKIDINLNYNLNGNFYNLNIYSDMNFYVKLQTFIHELLSERR